MQLAAFLPPSLLRLLGKQDVCSEAGLSAKFPLLQLVKGT
jgi:hypothetical protein